MQKEWGPVSEVSRFGDGKIGYIVFISLVKYEVRKSDEVEVGETGIVGLTRRYSRGERSPLLPFELRPDYLDESGMGSRDPCRPCRGKLGPGHKPK